jgi:hypothetical protein
LWFDILWSWRVTGESLLRVGGQVVSARPDALRGQGFVLDQLWIGSGWRVIQAIPPAQPVYQPALTFIGDIGRVRVRVLTRERSERWLDGVTPVDKASRQILAPCAGTVAAAIRQIAAVLRNLMSAVVAQEVSVWNTGDPGRPVSLEGEKLHGYAAVAARWMARYLAGDAGALEKFSAALRAFLSLLRQRAGSRVKEATAEVKTILAAVDISAGCKEQAARVRGKYPAEIKRLETLFATIRNLVRDELGVDWIG